MDPIRLDSKASLAGGWVGVPDARSMPARARDAGAASAALPGVANDTPKARAWWRRGVRFARDAAIGLSILAAIPFAVIGVRGDALLRDVSGVRERLAEVERLRPLMTARDAAITPTEAGSLLHRLNPTTAQPGLPMRAVAEAPARPWENAALTDDMFASLRTTGSEGTMAAGIVTAAARGFSDKELAYLRSVAEAPIWRDVERLASAPAVDMIGGRFVVPFRADALAQSMPVVRFADTKRLAYAGVSRAAYYVATGQPERAEAALKTVMSYGFLLVDNGSYLLDAMIGRMMIGIGQNGLHQLYTVTGDTRGMAATAPYASTAGQAVSPVRRAPDARAEMARLLRDAGDPGMPRTVRLEALNQLAFSSCSSVRGVLLGTSEAVRDAFAQARGDLARYPSERAYLDLMYGTVDRLPTRPARTWIGEEMIMGAATATSAVLGNPRVAACTLMVLRNF